MNAILIIALVACLYLPAAMLVGHRLRRMRLAYPTAETLAGGAPAALSTASAANSSAPNIYQRKSSIFLTDKRPSVSQMMRQHTSQPILS